MVLVAHTIEQARKLVEDKYGECGFVENETEDYWQFRQWGWSCKVLKKGN